MTPVGRSRWARWLVRMIEGAFEPDRRAIQTGPSWEERWGTAPAPALNITRFAEALVPPEGVRRSSLRRSDEVQARRTYIHKLLRGACGVSPEQAWDVGETLSRMPERSWCSGLLSLSVAEDYHEHVLGWFGTLLSDATLRRAFLERRLMACLIQLVTQPGFFGNIEHLMRPNWYFTDLQRHAANKAWEKWRKREAIEDFPPVVQAAMLQYRAITNNARRQGIERDLRSMPIAQESPVDAVNGNALELAVTMLEAWLRRQYGCSFRMADVSYGKADIKAIEPWPMGDPFAEDARSEWCRAIRNNALELVMGDAADLQFSGGISDVGWITGALTNMQYLAQPQGLNGSVIPDNTRLVVVLLAEYFICNLVEPTNTRQARWDQAFADVGFHASTPIRHQAIFDTLFSATGTYRHLRDSAHWGDRGFVPINEDGSLRE